MDQAEDFPPFDAAEELPDGEPKSRTRKARSDSGKPRAPRATSNVKLAKELAEPLGMIGVMLSMTLPTPGAVLTDRAEVTAAALVKMAEKRPGMMKILRGMSQVGPAGDVIQTIVMLIIAAQIDMNKTAPDGMMAQATGVTPIWFELQEALQGARGHMAPPDESTSSGQGFGDFNMPPPPEMGFDEEGIYNAPPMFRAGSGAGSIN